MKKHSPKGFYEFEQRNERTSVDSSVYQFITTVEAWANRVRRKAGVKLKPRGELLKVAMDRHHADDVHLALLALMQAKKLRAALDIAAEKGDEMKRQTFWCVDRTMQFCMLAYAGKMVETENLTWTGKRVSDGGKSSGVQSRKVTQAQREEIHRRMATAPHFKRTQVKRKLARDLDLSRRTIERIIAEK